MQNNVEVVHTYRHHIMNAMSPGNLHLFISAYNRYPVPFSHTVAAFVGPELRWGRGGESIKLIAAPEQIDEQNKGAQEGPQEVRCLPEF